MTDGVGWNYIRKNLTTCGKSENKPPTSCDFRTLVTSCRNKLLTTCNSLSVLLQGCSNKTDTVKADSVTVMCCLLTIFLIDVCIRLARITL